MARTTEPDELPIDTWGEVTDVVRVPNRPAMDALADRHIYLPPLIDMRFNYKPHNPLYLLLVRAWRLPAVHTIANTPGVRGGAGAGVPLESVIDTAGSVPALDDAAYLSARQGVLDTLAAHGPAAGR